MAFNAFTEVKIDDENGLLLVKGFCDPLLGAGAQILVSASKDPRDPEAPRCQIAALNPQSDGWHAEIPLSEVPVDDGDRVFIGGFATAEGVDDYLWADAVEVGVKAG